MQKPIKYAIFQTKWGHFGLAGTESALCRTHLPGPNPENIKTLLLKNTNAAEFDRTCFKSIQQQIIAYFDGSCVNFNNIPIALGGFSQFTRSVLDLCHEITFGQTITYAELAARAGRPAAARAVGSALAKNPLPLLVPCHRILRSDGQIGGFSAPGAMNLKAKLLKHEHAALIDRRTV